MYYFCNRFCVQTLNLIINNKIFTTMKKVLFLAVAVVAAFSFSSCKKTCTCTNDQTGKSEKVKTDKDYSTCAEIEDALDDAGMGYYTFTCK